MAYYQATSQHLEQWWPTLLTHICVIHPLWVKTLFQWKLQLLSKDFENDFQLLLSGVISVKTKWYWMVHKEPNCMSMTLVAAVEYHCSDIIFPVGTTFPGNLAWININGLHQWFYMDVISHQCHNFKGGWTKPPLKLGRGWVIICHCFTLM